MKAMIISFVCVLTFATQSLSAQNLTLEVRGIENVAGKLYVAIYNSQETFMKKPLAGFAVEVKDKVVSIPCKGLPVGTYAFSMYQDENGSYKINFEDFERQIVEKRIRLFILCSPHNPVSRVWTREELEKLGDICKKHGVIVVSDEIHADFVFEGKHQVFADLKPEYKDFTVICTSPGKTFNIAGLQASNILIPNEALREAFAKQITAAGYSQISAPGIEAVIAAYAQGEEWYQEMKKYVGANITFLHEWMEEHIPQIKVTKTEGTYLVWMDFRGLGIAEKNLKDFVENQAGLWLDGGKMFGESGIGFQRINVACPRKTLEKALTQLESAVKNL